MSPESPLGGQAVPNTGVSIWCSVLFSRGHLGTWRSGKSQCAPVRPVTSRCLGTPGRLAGSRSAPHPVIFRSSASRGGVSCGFSDRYGMAFPSSVNRRNDDGFHAVIELAREHVVAL